MNLNIKPGADVVAIKDHPQGHFKKYHLFPVNGIYKPVCSHSGRLLDIGIKNHCLWSCCGKCGAEAPQPNLYSEHNFVPLDELDNIAQQLYELMLTPADWATVNGIML